MLTVEQYYLATGSLGRQALLAETMQEQERSQGIPSSAWPDFRDRYARDLLEGAHVGHQRKFALA